MEKQHEPASLTTRERSTSGKGLRTDRRLLFLLKIIEITRLIKGQLWKKIIYTCVMVKKHFLKIVEYTHRWVCIFLCTVYRIIKSQSKCSLLSLWEKNLLELLKSPGFQIQPWFIFQGIFLLVLLFLHRENWVFLKGRKIKSHLRVHSLLTNSLEICGQANPCFHFETETAVDEF